ncbi:hypothetical protein G7054_g3727 [Neopestalotiopsis clavispora]|nr:hypothetical protein G7054_g3727 [Neopestalotiopsis clavispora]
MASNSDFLYKPFKDPENQLRLLHIELVSDELGEALHGTLHTFSHEDAPPYRPVSYTWGTQEASSDLLLRHPGEQEWHHFPIRPNLEALLKQFRAFVRPSRITEYFWIDAICINQRDDDEKGYQVRNMHKVYRYRGVAIWLGETSDNSDLAMDLVDRFEKIVTVADNGIKNGSSPTDLVDPFNALARETDDESWQAFYDLISRPWFFRRWIVQEYVLSAYKHFWVGHRATSIGMIMGLVRLFRLQPRYLDLRQKSNYCHRDPYHVHELLTPELDPVERIIRLSTAYHAFHGGKTSELTLERLLDNFAGFSSFDPRDGIYAFLSIASDIDISEWFPDYSSTAKTVHVYALAAMHIMKASGKSDIICRRAQRKGQSYASDQSG